MYIEQRGKRSFRAVEMKDGIRYSVTFDHRPTNAEATTAIAKLYEKRPATAKRTADMTLADAANAYIEAKSATISPSTIRGYRSIVRNLPKKLAETHILDITYAQVQTAINTYAKDHSAKSTLNFGTFISSVLFFHDLKFEKFSYPARSRKEPYIPTEQEVTAILHELKGTPYEIPILLATFGLRLSEICALDISDLSEENIIYVHRAKVRGERGYITKETTKTDESTRKIAISPYIADLIRKTGVIYTGYPNQILKHLTATQDALGIEHFSLHKLRHFFASYMHDKGYSDAAILAAGGWKGDNIMKSVYRHSMAKDETSQKMSADLDNLIPKEDS